LAGHGMIEVLDTPSPLVSRVRVNRAAHANSLTPELARQLAGAIEAEGRTRPCVIVESEGSTFCAGADLDFLDQASQEDSSAVLQDIEHAFQSVVRTIWSSPAIVFASIQGPALGAGAEIALACDIRIASANSWLEESWINLGLISALGGAHHLTRILGVGDALELLLTGRRIEADECRRRGLFQSVTQPDELAAAVFTMAEAVASKNPRAVQAMKRLCRGAVSNGLDESMRVSADIQSQLVAAAPFRASLAEVLASQLGKKVPVPRAVSDPSPEGSAS
jgi:2-(1,2-epoxy-1,2-dihydrophenyl)acetyl-CoA isomerase